MTDDALFRLAADLLTAGGNPFPLVNSVPVALLTMAACHQAWARRFMPWTMAGFDD